MNLTEDQQQVLVTHVRELTSALADAANFIYSHVNTRAGDEITHSLRDFNKRLYEARLAAGLES